MNLYLGDCREVLKGFHSDSIDAIITDPPYGYSFMNKDWDKAVIGVETWKECIRVLKPGAFAAIMSSPRQDVLSRMIVNLQDAGFRTDFTSIYWTYASGFPKAANVSKLVDKRLGIKPLEIKPASGVGFMKPDSTDWNITKNQEIMPPPTTEKAQELDGSYAGFQPKPAVEVILMVMKPIKEKTFVDQALTNGKGITWLDNVRIPFQDEKDTWSYPNGPGGLYSQDYQQNNKIAHDWNKFTTIKDNEPSQSNNKGRFPANLLVSDDVLNDGHIRKSGKMKANTCRSNLNGYTGPMPQKTLNETIGDSGSYSRYFNLDKWFETTFPFIITPKASSSEKNRGLDKWIHSTVNDGRNKSIDNPFQRGETLRQNTHPTVKPIKLMSYLVALLTKEGETVLDTFCGSGTTLIAAKLLHRKYIGIELNEEYVEITKARINSNIHTLI